MARPRKTTGRRWVVLVSVLALVALAPAPMVTAQPATPDGNATDAITLQALGAQKLVFKATVDASKQDAPRIAAKNYKAQTSGRHVFKLKWPGDAHLKLFIYDSDGNRIAAKGNTTQPKKLGVVLEAGEKYKIKVKAATGKATFKLFVRAPMWTPGDFFDDLPSWEDIHPYVPFADETTAEGEWQLNPADPSEECRVLEKTLSDSAEDIVTFGVASSFLWPGTLVEGDGYDGGITTIKELPIRERAPADIFVDFGRADIRRTVTDPTPGRLAAAVGDIIEQAENAGYEPGTDVFYEDTETFQSEQLALHLGLSAKYMKARMKAKLDMERSESESTVTVYFKETAFTASMEQPPTPGEFFSDALTQAAINRHIDMGRLDDHHNIPVYVSSVTYGRILVFSVTSSASALEIRAAIEAAYDGGAFEMDAEARAEYNRVMSGSRRHMVTVGGSSEAAASAIVSGSFRDYFTIDPALTEYVPISYVIKDLEGNTAYIGETTDYSARECRPAQQEVVRVTFDRAYLVNFSDPLDQGDGIELDRFQFELNAWDRVDGNDPGTPVFQAGDVCPYYQPEPIHKKVKCWENRGYDFVRRNQVWQTNEARNGQWYLEVPFDDTGTTGYLEYAKLQLRAEFRDYDVLFGNEWTVVWDVVLEGEDMWEDYLPDDDTATRMFEANNNGSHWQVYVRIEKVPAD